MSSNSSAEETSPGKRIKVNNTFNGSASKQFTVEYEAVPPQIWLSNLQRVVKDCRNTYVQLQFVQVASVDQTAGTDQPGKYGHTYRQKL